MDILSIRPRLRGVVLALGFVASAVALASCSGSPTTPLENGCRDATIVFAGEQFYQERTEFPTAVRGRLRKACPAPTPGGRDHCYFLDATPVYSGGREQVLDRFVGVDVVIVGKRVQLPPFEPEIWPGAICRQGT